MEPLMDIGPMFPGMRFVQAKLSQLNLPPLAGDLVYIASDIGGEHAESGALVYTALFTALYGSADWEIRRRKLRRQFLSDGRRMSYKRLGSDRKRQDALPYFLESASLIDGVLVSFVYDKKLKFTMSNSETLKFWRDNVGLHGKWNPKTFERLICSANLVSLLIGSLGREGQNVYWISDNDAIFASHGHHQDAARVVSGLGNIYIKHTPGQLGVGTASIDTGDRAEEDLIAICDLVAGTLSEICTLQFAKTGSDKNVYSTSLSEKSQFIGEWMMSSGKRLSHATFMFGDSEEGAFGVRCLQLSESRIVRPC